MKLLWDKTEQRFQGLPVSGGVAMARVFLVKSDDHDTTPHYSIDAAEVAEECARLEQALAAAVEETESLISRVAKRLGPTYSAIFEVQKTMLEDSAVVDSLHHVIAEDRVNAETAVEKVLHEYERRLHELGDEYLRERVSDIADVRRRLCGVLGRSGRAPGVVLVDKTFRQGEQRIIVAEELTPGLTAGLDTANTLGFITARGGRASHAAILARALGIPAVSGIDNVHRMLGHGEMALINGNTGEVTVWPEERSLELYPSLDRSPVAPLQALEPLESIHVMANINRAEEAEAALAVQADGVGLYRTEYELLAAGRVLDEDEQAERYAHVLDAMGDRPVYIRLFDLGGDKSAPFLGLPEEDNPALGFRGARLLQARPELLITQARALARVSRKRMVHVMYPMIVECEQFLKLRSLIVQYTRDIEGAHLVHGVMFEVPSAYVDADRILQVAEFASIGSNDLMQYLYAIDRSNEHVAYDFVQDREVYWRVIEGLANAAHASGRPLGLCGEIGAQEECMLRLVKLGLGHVSVSPRLVSTVRTAARRAGVV